MKRITLAVLLIGLISASTLAQNNIWYFGSYSEGGGYKSYGLDFTSGTPVQRNGESAIGYYESVSVVSDNSGNVLYYTNGVKLYDGSHQLMSGAPNQLLGPVDGFNGTAVQGAYSVLKPGSQSEYYLFTSQGLDGAANGFRVNRIDMSQPGNGSVGSPLGEVVTSDSLILGSGSELMTAYGKCSSDSIWLLSHSPNSYDFVKVLITSAGIANVSTQNVPTPTQGGGTGFLGTRGRGSMALNSDGTKIIFTAMENAGSFILDFDKNTGNISNPVEIRVPSGIGAITYPYNGYGCEFSPDGTKAYLCAIQTAWGTPCIWQYDIASATIAVVPGSTGRNFAEIITGPDDKLYVGKVSQENQLTLGVMDNPNNPVGSVGFDPDGITFPSLGGNPAISYAMPQGFFCPLSACNIDAVGSQCDTTSAFQLTASPTGGTWGGGAYITGGGIFDPGAAGPGTHWVTYDAGCDEPDSLEITVNQCCPNIDPNLGANNSICADATQNLDAGGGMDTYRWYENGTLLVTETTRLLTADSGTYVVEVTNSAGCTGRDTIEIGNHALPTPDLGPDTSYCVGGTVTVNAGGGYVSYSWSPSGGGSQTAVFSAANTYTVTVEDANGCEGSDAIIISEAALPTPSISDGSIVCENGSLSLTGTIGGGSTLNWTGLGTANPLLVTGAGTYTLVETDANGCVDSVSRAVTQEDAPSVEIGGPYAVCDGQQTEVLDANTGTAGDTYLWSDASTADTLAVSSAGQYSVIVTSANDCEAFDTAIVTVVGLPTVDLGPDTFYCASSTVTLNTGGGFTDYTWSTGGTEATESVNTAGAVWVEVEDANGCTDRDTVLIAENDLPTVDLGGDAAICGGDSATLRATHVDGVSYLWTPNGETSDTLRIPGDPETYGVTITDNDGCVFSTSVTISQDSPPTVDIGDLYTLCHSQETQTLDASGNSGVTYLWSDGSTDPTLDVQDSGMYWVRVRTAGGCETIDTAYIDTFSLPTVDIGADTFFCSSATITLNTGGGYVNYTWSTGTNGPTESINSAGEVWVEVEDANGCTARDTVDVEENELPEVDLGNAISVCDEDSLTLNAWHVDAASYLWTPNGETSDTIRVGAEDATYTVTITDDDGCTFTASREISEANPPTVNIGGDDIICDDSTKVLDAGFAADVTYEWYLDGALLPEDTLQTLGADSGIYVVVVRSSIGCEASDTAYIDNHQLPTVSLNSDYTFCELDSVELDGGSSVAYLWNTGATTQTIWASTAGDYEVELTDANGCTNSASATISESALPDVDLGGSDSACVGLEIDLDATVSNGVSYLWDDGSTDPDYTVIGPDTVSVIVTDDNNCIGYDTIYIKALDSLDLTSLADNNQVCEGQEDQNPLDAGPFDGGDYDWTLPDGSNEVGNPIVPLLNGWYVINVTDRFNCKGHDSIMNVVVDIPEIDLGPDDSLCSTGRYTIDIPMNVLTNHIGTFTWEDSNGNTDNNNSLDSVFTADDAPLTIIGSFEDAASGCVVEDTVELVEYCEETVVTVDDFTCFGCGTDPDGVGPDFPPGTDVINEILNNILWSDFEVFNRWGLKVFQSSDMLPNWDGYFENNPVPSGVYYWVYKYEDSSRKIHQYNGFTQVIQNLK